MSIAPALPTRHVRLHEPEPSEDTLEVGPIRGIHEQVQVAQALESFVERGVALPVAEAYAAAIQLLDQCAGYVKHRLSRASSAHGSPAVRAARQARHRAAPGPD